MKNLLITLTFFSIYSLNAQIAYTTNDYSFTVESNLVYGSAIDFSGATVDLEMDIYKPINANCSRPCLVLVHGGGWIGGSKEDIPLVNIAQEFAEKGFVVATINYRLGVHVRNFYTPYAVCPQNLCSYTADTSEAIRAIYRGQQDVKGAIRFMKMRNAIDSTDITNFFVAGESAGGFNVLAATFLDDPSEKYPQAFAIANAPTPDPDLIACLPQGYSLARPDLGPIEGTLNIGNYDASVEGVGNIYGGLLNFDLLQNTTDWPEMYFFHQGSDVVVHYNYGRLLGRLDGECYQPSNVCFFLANSNPYAYGSKGIVTLLNSLPSPPNYVASIIENFEYNFDCFDNGHSIDNWIVRSQEMADLFALRIQVNGNTGNATNCDAGLSELFDHSVSIVPNPSAGTIELQGEIGENYEVLVLSLSGKVVTEFDFSNSKQLTLESGVYLFRFTSQLGTGFKRVIIQ